MRGLEVGVEGVALEHVESPDALGILEGPPGKGGKLPLAQREQHAVASGAAHPRKARPIGTAKVQVAHGASSGNVNVIPIGERAQARIASVMVLRSWSGTMIS